MLCSLPLTTQLFRIPAGGRQHFSSSAELWLHHYGHWTLCRGVDNAFWNSNWSLWLELDENLFPTIKFWCHFTASNAFSTYIEKALCQMLPKKLQCIGRVDKLIKYCQLAPKHFYCAVESRSQHFNCALLWKADTANIYFSFVKCPPQHSHCAVESRRGTKLLRF